MATGLGGEQLWLSPTVANNVNPYDDQSGQGNNGTNYGSTVVSDTASGGTYAYEFTASVQNVIKTDFDFGGKTNFSWSAWIYDDRRSNPSNAHNAYFSFSGRGTAQYSQDIYFFSLQGEQGFQVNSGADGGNRYTDGLQVWKHMAVIYDGTEAVASDRLKYYENGVQATPTSTFNYPTSVPTNTASPDTQIGGYAMTANSTHWFTGKQDDIRIFDRTLTQAEITHLATSRGVLGPPGGASFYNPFINETFENKSFRNPRF